MADVESWDLRNSTQSLLDRVKSGETITITVDGRPTAVLAPVGRRPRWLTRTEFTATIFEHQADPRLNDELADLAGEMTDEFPLP